MPETTGKGVCVEGIKHNTLYYAYVLRIGTCTALYIPYNGVSSVKARALMPYISYLHTLFDSDSEINRISGPGVIFLSRLLTETHFHQKNKE